MESLTKIKMKRNVIIRAIIGVVVLGVVGLYFLNSKSKNQGIFCPNYDSNQEECLEHKECEWDDGESNCDLIGSVKNEDEGDNEDEEGDEDERGGFNRELENISVPDNISNRLCKQIPLSNQSPYSERYRCLALVNHDERFCEGIDEEDEKTMCLAFTKEDSSYCKLISSQDAKRVCYIQLSVSTKNARFCSDITYNQHEKEQCYMNYITNLYAWNKSDEIKTEYCNELDTPDKYTCHALKERDVSLCGNNPNCLTFFKQELSFVTKIRNYLVV